MDSPLDGKHVLVSGSKGFMGKRLCHALEEKGAKVVSLDIQDGIDIRDWSQVGKTAESLDIIYHLAAISYVPFSFENPRKTYEVNVLGTLNMLELGRKLDVEKIIYTSSYVYGKPQYLPIDEKHPIDPHNPYARSKIIGEELVKGYNKDSGLPGVILRPFNIYGEGQNNDFLIPSIVKQVKTGKIKLKDPKPKRDFLYVDDMINAYIKAGEFTVSGLDVVNIGYGESFSVEEILEKIIRLSNQRVQVSYTKESRKNEIMDTVADIGKAKKLLNWQPETDINEGLKNILDSTIRPGKN